MKTINFRNPIPEEIAEAGISLVCNENMDVVISDEDFKRLELEFPDAFMDCYIVTEHNAENDVVL